MSDGVGGPVGEQRTESNVNGVSGCFLSWPAVASDVTSQAPSETNLQPWRVSHECAAAEPSLPQGQSSGRYQSRAAKRGR